MRDHQHVAYVAMAAGSQEGAGSGEGVGSREDGRSQEGVASRCGVEGADVCALQARGLDKTFVGVHALRGVDFDLKSGEVHGLVGANGAGKSTLIKMLVGAYVPDAGTVDVFGENMPLGDPRGSQAAGIAIMYQELMIVPEMSAISNVFLGDLPRRGPWVSWADARRRFAEVADVLGGVPFGPGAIAGTLSVANQRILEVMRALVAEHRIVIMDEPTASLGPVERERLYEIVKTLRSEGVAVLYVSHDLDEVLALADRITVMRNGEVSSTGEVDSWTKSSLVAAMLGRELAKLEPQHRTPSGDEVLRVEGLSLPGVLSDVSFVLRRGEVLGIAGLVGSGRTELLRALSGADRVSGGRLFIEGEPVPWPKSVRQALRLGLALAPEDRHNQGLVLSLSAAENVCLTDLRSAAQGPMLSKTSELSKAALVTEGLAFDRARLKHLAATFSGGNQQKLVVAKWLHRGPRVLMMDEFTRGIDVGAKAEMFSVIRQLADGGMGVIAVSAELEEVLEVSDTILVLAKGRLMGEPLAAREASLNTILSQIFDAEKEA